MVRGVISAGVCDVGARPDRSRLLPTVRRLCCITSPDWFACPAGSTNCSRSGALDHRNPDTGSSCRWLLQGLSGSQKRCCDICNAFRIGRRGGVALLIVVTKPSRRYAGKRAADASPSAAIQIEYGDIHLVKPGGKISSNLAGKSRQPRRENAAPALLAAPPRFARAQPKEKALPAGLVNLPCRDERGV